MRNKMLPLSIVLTLGLVMIACNLPFVNTATQDTGQVATSVAQTVAALNAQQQTVPTLTPQIPTLGPAPTQTLQPLPTQVLPATATPLPCNWAKLVSETVIDGTSININTNFNKSWRIRNAGTCTWNANYKIKFVSGDAMSGPASKNFSGNVAPGATIDLILPLKAPGTAGTYKGYWHLFGDDNVDFTNSYGLWVSINAVNPVAFAVTGVTPSVDTAGPIACGHAFVFTANITANGAGTVTYQWKFSNGGSGATQSMVFGAAGTLPAVPSNWSPSIAGPYWAQIYVDNPNHQYFSKVNFSCT
jgi:hypothetical protein